MIKERVCPILIAGKFCEANYNETFQAYNPATSEKLPEIYPVSEWADLEKALEASHRVRLELARCHPDKIAAFFDLYADLLEKNRESIVRQANLETA
ncbi:MAG: ketoglutarate semialdehyde dehydrogenase, partial [Candidatus Aminicenantes bacterium]